MLSRRGGRRALTGQPVAVDWQPVVREVLDQHGGLATRRQLVERLPKWVLDGYIGRRHLDRVFPHVYCAAGRRVDDRMLLRAALLSVGHGSALSHTTALSVHGVRGLERPLHVTVDQGTRRAGTQGLVVHRRLDFRAQAPQCQTTHGLLVTPLARSVVDAWPLLPVTERRPLVLDLVRQRRVTLRDLQDSLTERPNVGGHRSLAQALDLLGDGFRSELEVLGVLHVFRHRSLPSSVGQHHIDLAGRSVFLDRAWPEVKLAVELDGRRHHTSPTDRQRDLERDVALAALGWVVLRFTYAEVRLDPEGVRRRVREAYRARAAQLLAS
jgi:hypothetical protein